MEESADQSDTYDNIVILSYIAFEFFTNDIEIKLQIRVGVNIYSHFTSKMNFS